MDNRIRLAGWAALAAGGVHLLQFLVLGIGGVLAEPEFPNAAQASDNYWFGVLGCLTFGLIAVAYLVFFSAATAITENTADCADTVWRSTMGSAATIGIAAWLLSGASNLARRGFNATALAEASGGNPDIERAVLQGAYLTTSTAAIAMAIAFAVWFAAFAIRARRAEVIGIPGAAVCWLAAIVPLVGWATNLGGIPAIIVCLLALGGILLRRSRRAAHSIVRQ